MQIGMKEQDRNVLSFRWPSEKGVNQYQYKRILIFGGKCTHSFAIFALLQKGKNYCVHQPEIFNLTNESFYMNYLVHSFQSATVTEISVLALKS